MVIDSAIARVRGLRLALLLTFVMLAGCATSGPTSPADPWEGFNRKIFAFNQTVDRYALKPLAQGYQFVTPDPVERGVRNFFRNLQEPVVIVNDLLQLKFLQAASDTGRFLVNSTVGIVGIFDVATRWGMPRHEEDFGQTLAFWGVPAGPYIELPFLGGRTLRHAASIYPDGLASPYYWAEADTEFRNGLFVLDIISLRAELLPAEALIRGDRYLFLRDAYLQRRDYLVNDGKVDDPFAAEELDDFEFPEE